MLDIPNTRLWVHRQPQAGEYSSVVPYSTGQVYPVALPDVAVEIDRLLR